MTYKTQLADPRWKAKREEILERDGFACRVCFSTKRLIVHHISYADSPVSQTEKRFASDFIPLWPGVVQCG